MTPLRITHHTLQITPLSWCRLGRADRQVQFPNRKLLAWIRDLGAGAWGRLPVWGADRGTGRTPELVGQLFGVFCRADTLATAVVDRGRKLAGREKIRFRNFFFKVLIFKRLWWGDGFFKKKYDRLGLLMWHRICYMLIHVGYKARLIQGPLGAKDIENICR